MSTGCFSSIRHLWSSQKSVSCGRFLKKTRLWVIIPIPADNFENKLEMRKTDLKVTYSYLAFPYPSPEHTHKTGKAIAFIGMQFWRVVLKTVRYRNVWGFHGSKKGGLEGRCFKICYFFSHYCTLIGLVINKTNFPKSSLFCPWWGITPNILANFLPLFLIYLHQRHIWYI